MRAITVQSWRIVVVLLILVGVSAWQWPFVANAIGANPTLNLVIMGTFVFGLTLVFSAMLTFRKEHQAFCALTEFYDDIANQERLQAADPLWRYYRCANLGIVYKRPRILGQVYQLVMAQLHRDGELRISASTLQTLTEGIDSRMREAKALIAYVAGILIFLGLIGTFIGLMMTLASVGDILGGLDLTGADPVATVATLMGNLQVPLGGMATGFRLLFSGWLGH